MKGAGSEWLWRLSSPMRGGALSGRGSGREARVGRGWSLDELDDPTSLPPPTPGDHQLHALRKTRTEKGMPDEETVAGAPITSDGVVESPEQREPRYFDYEGEIVAAAASRSDVDAARAPYVDEEFAAFPSAQGSDLPYSRLIDRVHLSCRVDHAEESTVLVSSRAAATSPSPSQR